MRVRVVGVVCAVALVVSGCSGKSAEGGPAATATSSTAGGVTGVGSEATDEPTESAPVYVPLDQAEVGDVVEVEVPVKPEPSAAMAVNDEAGARAAVRYFYDVINYTLLAPDHSAIREIASSDCEYCAGMEEDARDLQRDKKRPAQPGQVLKSIDAIRPLSKTAWTALTTSDYPKVILINEESRVVEKQEELGVLEDQIIVEFNDGAWTLVAFGERGL